MTDLEIMERINEGLDTNPYYVEDLFVEADFFDDCTSNSTKFKISTREILTLWFRGYNYNQIGKKLGCAHTVVSKRIKNFGAYLLEQD